MTALKVLFVFGTRPEAIKLAPLVRLCRQQKNLEVVVCLTAQHREMLDQVLDYWTLIPDVDLNLMQPDQTLAALTARCLEAVDRVLQDVQPHCLVIQGDTTTAMSAGLAFLYRRLPVVHVEAGLRTGNLRAPWPEELNRRVATLVSSLHCAPTQRAAEQLIGEGVEPQRVHVTGNTVVDALLETIRRERGSRRLKDKYAWLDGRRLVLMTGHRRESFGAGLANTCAAVAELAERHADVEFVYPVHLNPYVQRAVYASLDGFPNVRLMKPLAYPEFVWLMDRAYLLITDSGGVQEEAPSLRTPVLVTREVTERPEAVDAGAVELVGSDQARIVAAAERLLGNDHEYRRRQIDHNPYGDGRAAERIVRLMLRQDWASNQGRST